MDRASLYLRMRLGALALALATLALLAVAGARGAERIAPLKIGAVFSLTGGGNVYGPQQAKAAQLAVDELNEAGGVGGVPLRLVVVDDHSKPADGKRAMRRLIQKDHVVAILGPTLSLVAVAADPVANQLKTPVVAVSNTAEGIVGTCAYPCEWIWRDSLGEAIAVPANIAQFVGEQHPATAAIVSVADDKLGIDEARIATAAFAKEHVTLVARTQVPASGAVKSAVRRALAAKPGVIFVGASFGKIAAAVMKEARAHGYRGTFLGGNTFNSSVSAGLAGKAGIGARSASAWYAGNNFPANTNFVSSYRQRYGAAPDQFAAQSYIGVQILESALSRGAAAGDKPIATRRAQVQQALATVALTTPLGPFHFTPDHDVDQIVWVLAITAGGGHRLVGFCNPDC
jgi:branched-chain amino acid transport system substrate-binding protein